MPVQTIAGSYASHYFSSEWGGSVRISHLLVNPLGRVGLSGIELVSPTGDTIFVCEHLGVRFHKMPIDDEGLCLDRVSITNAYYHLGFDDSTGINLKYIFKYFKDRSTPDTTDTVSSPFIVRVKRLMLNGIEFRMDLKDHGNPGYREHGVCYKHQHYYDVRANIADIRVNADDISCRILRFAAREQSGFALRHLSCLAKVSPFGISAQQMELTTDSTHLMLDAALQYNTWGGMSDYCDSVRHTLTIHPGSVACMTDAAYWAPVLWGLNQTISINGHAEGPIANLDIDSLALDINQQLSLCINGSVEGLPHIMSTQFHVSVDHLKTSYQALRHITLPEKASPITIPSLLKPLADISGQLRVDGQADNCAASATFRTSIGTASADLTVQRDAGDARYHATAHVASPSLSLAKLLPNEWVSRTGLRATIECEGNAYANLTAHAEGELYSMLLCGIPIKPATFSAAFGQDNLSFDLDIDDELLSLSAEASYANDNENQALHADILVNHCELSSLHILTTDSTSDIATHLRADLHGNSMNNLSGSASLANTVFTYNGNSIILNNILLTIREIENYKNILVTSDWLNFSMKGLLHYEELPLIAQDLMTRYCPANFNPWRGTPMPLPPTESSFSFNARWKGEYNQLHPFNIPICLANGTSLNGSYSPAESLKIVLRSDSITASAITLRDVGIIGKPRHEIYSLQVDAEKLCVGQPTILEDVSLLADLSSDSSHLSLQNGSLGDIHNMRIDLNLLSDSATNIISLQHGRFNLAERLWSISCDDGFEIQSGHYSLPSLVVSDGTQSINASLAIDSTQTDQVQLTLSNLNFAWITQLWLASSGFDLDGRINGMVTLLGLTSTPYLEANLKIQDCKVNDYQLDQIALQTDWNAEQQQLNIQLDTRSLTGADGYVPLKADGSILMSQESPILNINATFDHFPLETVTPLLSSFASRFEGEMHGNLHIGGPLKQIQFTGDAIIEQGLLSIAATGVTYRFSDTIHLQNQRITLSDFKARDPLNHVLTIDGYILTNGLQATDMDLSVNADNFMLFSIPERPDVASGLIMAALSGRVQGSSNDLRLNISARTNRGSVLSIPVDDRKMVSENQFITFVSPSAERQDDKIAETPAASSPFTMTLSLELTPDLRLKLPMTFQQIAPKLTASGSGNVLLSMKGGSSTVTGSYELSSGSLVLELFSLLSTNFTLDAGSTIILPGNINNAIFDIKASHLVHANLASLMGTSVETSGRTVNVEDVIVLSGTLANPSVSFDIRFPGADKSVEEEVSAYIDRSNERDVITQAMSLLLTGQFSNATSSSSMIDNASAGGYNIATSTLGNMVSNVVQVVDVNFGYQGETALTREQFDIDIRKEWDRLYFETTLGYGGEAIALEGNDATTNLIGDVLVGYKINPRLHLFVFNRTNTNDFTRTELPYKQGVGLKLTRDFNRWGDIFSHSKK